MFYSIGPGHHRILFTPCSTRRGTPVLNESRIAYLPQMADEDFIHIYVHTFKLLSYKIINEHTHPHTHTHTDIKVFFKP